MKRHLLDKSSLFLIAIVAVVVAVSLAFFLILRTNRIDEAIKGDRIINILIVLERDGKPVATELFLYYASTGRGAFLDIPGETGLIIKSMNRVDRIDAVYKPDDPTPYVSEVAGLVDAELPYYIVCNGEQFRRLVDLLDGLSVFIPNPVDAQSGDSRVLLPSGAVTLDGDKMAAYGLFPLPDEPENDRIERRQKMIQALFRKIGDREEYVSRKDMFPHLYRNIRTNIDRESLRRLFMEFARLDVDRIVMQKTTGVTTKVDGKELLDPLWDGELVKDIVKQTLNALASSDTFSVEDKIFRIEILNGTDARGLAKKTADIFQSFGYEVVSVENAERQDYENTTIFDRFGNDGAAGTIAGVIRCTETKTGSYEGRQDSIADFQILLGKDFNGRYCDY
ncbi:MAG: LCP family protein [Spirochaetes bacterium]|nr:LCP family protein [Spirochaetota bacterium]